MNKKIIGYECKHCGKREGQHAVLDKWCPLPKQKQTAFVAFNETKYEKNPDKPIYGAGKI